MHNAKFDIGVLSRHGYDAGRVYDTMLMAKVLYEHAPSYSLKALAWHFLGRTHLTRLEVEAHWLANGQTRSGDMRTLPKPLLHAYAKEDAELTLLLFWYLYESIKSKGMWGAVEREMAVVRPVMRMEQNGVLIDRPWVGWSYKACNRRLKMLHKRVLQVSGDKYFNINSGKQLANQLSMSNIELALTAMGNPKLDKKARQLIKHPLIELKDEIAKVTKLAETYYANLLKASDKDGRILPNFELSEAKTRRFSSRGLGDIKLNWQNFPEEARRAVIVPEGLVGWFFDYRQIENVIHIHFSGDKVRRKSYEADEEWSEYLWLSERILGKRITKEDPHYRLIKSTKLGMNYGMGVNKFAQYHSLPLDQARKMFDQVRSACPAIRQLQKMVESKLARQGYVEDVFGYRYHGKADRAYKVVAYLIQGCAAALMKDALVRLDAIEGVTLRLTVHDEIYFTTPLKGADEIARKAKFAMTNYSSYFDGIPIRVETYKSTTSWADKKKVTL